MPIGKRKTSKMTDYEKDEIMNLILEKLTNIELLLFKQHEHKRQYSEKSSGTEDEDNIVVIKLYKNGVLCSGDTNFIKDIIKKCSGRWNFSLKGWILTINNGKKLARKLQEKLSEEQLDIQKEIL